eukprot:snap_masked-scaffold_8-processed-gene-3.23-mRNA-1 protein AED:1.00 eAED:1.00 QI:0/0/0/0/1/1/2/0/421
MNSIIQLARRISEEYFNAPFAVEYFGAQSPDETDPELPVASEYLEDSFDETEDVEDDQDIEQEKKSDCSVIITLLFLSILLGGLHIAGYLHSLVNEDVDEEIKYYCSNINKALLDDKQFKSFSIEEESQKTVYTFRTGTLNILPEFAFQCVIPLPEETGNVVPGKLVIILEAELLVKTTSFLMTDGKNVYPWNNTIDEIEFVTNGFFLEIEPRALSSTHFNYYELNILSFQIRNEDDLFLHYSSLNQINELRIIGNLVNETKPKLNFEQSFPYRSWKISSLQIQNVFLNLFNPSETSLKHLVLKEVDLIDFPYIFFSKFDYLESLEIGESGWKAFSTPDGRLEDYKVNSIKLVLPELEYIPDNFLRPFPKLIKLEVLGLSLFECSSSFLDRSGFEGDLSQLKLLGAFEEDNCSFLNNISRH